MSEETCLVIRERLREFFEQWIPQYVKEKKEALETQTIQSDTKPCFDDSKIENVIHCLDQLSPKQKISGLIETAIGNGQTLNLGIEANGIYHITGSSVYSRQKIA